MKKTRNKRLLLHDCIYIILWESKAGGQKPAHTSQELREKGIDGSLTGKLSGPMEMPCILAVVVITRLCTFAKTH